MRLEIDHVFVRVDQGFPEKSSLSKNIPVGNFRNHDDQGTAAEFVAFEKNYLEFIWLDSFKEARENPLELNKRFSANQCPFGVAFRGSLSSTLKNDFWVYNPEYMKNGCIWVHKSHKQDFSLPMIFVIDLPIELENFWPVKNDRWSKDQILPGCFEKVIISGPFDGSNIDFPNLQFKQASSYEMRIVGVEELEFGSLPICSEL